jgi:hypothetical protein
MIEISINDYNALVLTALCVFKIFYPKGDSLWLKHVAEVNTVDNIVLFMVLHSFIL